VNGWDPTRFRVELQSVLDGFVEEQVEASAGLGEDAGRLLTAAREAFTGGKRLRAMFCHWGFRAVREPADQGELSALLRAAAALELLHASALVHDDLMDASATRRGRPSIHRAFADEHRRQGWRGDPEQYGAAAAILLGDLLLSWSDELLRTCGPDTDAVLATLRVFDTTRREVVLGQFLDVSSQARGDREAAQAMRVLLYKSAKYSVERPLHVGATLAGASGEVLTALTAYGVPLGEAFQLRDDLLGVFGDPQVTGKPAGDDLTEGKRTLLVALAIERLPAQDAARLDDGLGRPLDRAEVAGLQTLIRQSGAAAEVEQLIEQLMARSVTAVEAAPLAGAARDALRGLAAAATRRTL